VAAHPDDEAIGLGALLPEMHEVCAIVHVTDGSPRRGNENWEHYAAVRRREFEQALAKAGAHSRRNMCLWCPDQEASFHIAELASRLAEMFERLRPAIVFTHPYEGGHPDHDATAAAVHGAARLLNTQFATLEFSSYHADASGMACECFLDNADAPVMERPLTFEQRQRKRALFECYASQREVLDQFPLRCEPVRVAPGYDFAQPPHEGQLFYERFDWGVNGAQWRELAAGAFRELGIQ
jgi:LmbE family N-acetylglucosaminyl deacetylase